MFRVTSGERVVTGTADRPATDNVREVTVAMNGTLPLGNVRLTGEVFGVKGATVPVATVDVAAKLTSDGTLTLPDGSPLRIAAEAKIRAVGLLQPERAMVGVPVKFTAYAIDTGGALVPTPPDFGRWRTANAYGPFPQPDGSWTPTAPGSVQPVFEVEGERLLDRGGDIPIFPAGVFRQLTARPTPFQDLTNVVPLPGLGNGALIDERTLEYRTFGGNVAYTGLFLRNGDLVGFTLDNRMTFVDVRAESLRRVVQFPKKISVKQGPLPLPDGKGVVFVAETSVPVSDTETRYQMWVMAFDWEGNELSRAEVPMPTGVDNGFLLYRVGKTFYVNTTNFRARGVQWDGTTLMDRGPIFPEGQNDDVLAITDTMIFFSNATYGEDPTRPLRDVGAPAAGMVLPDGSLIGYGRQDELVFCPDVFSSARFPFGPVRESPSLFGKGSLLLRNRSGDRSKDFVWQAPGLFAPTP